MNLLKQKKMRQKSESVKETHVIVKHGQYNLILSNFTCSYLFYDKNEYSAP